MMLFDRLLLSLAAVAVSASSAAAQTPPPSPATAPPVATPSGPPSPSPASTPAPPVTAVPVLHTKFDARLYGFVEVDSIYDTTESFNEIAGSSNIARPGTYPGDHGRTMLGARNSRIGMRLAAPEYRGIKALATLEMDFLGNQPPGTSEQSFWQNGTFRFRHMYLLLETAPVDILIGQTWQLFGWQTMAHPNTVGIQGMPGQVYSRSPQLRISKKLALGDIGLELAIAASRPPQRDSATPDGQAGVKLTFNRLEALHTAGSTGTAIDPLSIGISAVGRRFAVDELATTPTKQVDRYGYGISIDALVPLVPVTKRGGNALTLTASYSTGAGIADLYQSLTGGVSQPKLMGTGTYTADVDNGLVMFLPDGTLHPVQWTAIIAGLQYYLPPSGKTWLSVNYSHLHSDNAHFFGAASAVWDTEDWADANLMTDVTPAVRLGVEGAYFHQMYVDGRRAADYRGQLSAFFIF